MKTKILIFGLLFLITVEAQSVISLGANTVLGIGSGADFCAGSIEGTGIVSGDGTFCGSPTDVESEGPVMPAEYALEQNYPNPFNPGTRISWQLPADGRVRLNVYDALGNWIAALVDEYKPAGYYETAFDASGLPSGIYFYTLETGKFISAKKMILLK